MGSVTPTRHSSPGTNHSPQEWLLPDKEAILAQSISTLSLGPVASVLDSKLLLCPSRPRAMLPTTVDLRYAREDYASDVSDTDGECEVTIIKRRSCLLDKI